MQLTVPTATAEADLSWAANFPVGSTFPQINATDQSGKLRHNNNITGVNGFLVLFNRSVVW
ncbi:MAG: hypothetical protein KUG79_06900 [Pseudomonadales bacterium]|nr:hypothetical protein [Pseudomonadales bacterium]